MKEHKNNVLFDLIYTFGMTQKEIETETGIPQYRVSRLLNSDNFMQAVSAREYCLLCALYWGCKPFG